MRYYCAKNFYYLLRSFGVSFGIVYAILFITSHDWGDKEDPLDIEVLYDALYLIIPSPILYCLVLIQTQWVCKQLHKMEEISTKIHNKNQSKMDDMNGENTVMVCLKDIMSDFEGYKVFMGMCVPLSLHFEKNFLLKCPCHTQNT